MIFITTITLGLIASAFVSSIYALASAVSTTWAFSLGFVEFTIYTTIPSLFMGILSLVPVLTTLSILAYVIGLFVLPLLIATNHCMVYAHSNAHVVATYSYIGAMARRTHLIYGIIASLLWPLLGYILYSLLIGYDALLLAMSPFDGLVYKLPLVALCTPLLIGLVYLVMHWLTTRLVYVVLAAAVLSGVRLMAFCNAIPFSSSLLHRSLFFYMTSRSMSTSAVAAAPRSPKPKPSPRKRTPRQTYDDAYKAALVQSKLQGAPMVSKGDAYYLAFQTMVGPNGVIRTDKPQPQTTLSQAVIDAMPSYEFDLEHALPKLHVTRTSRSKKLMSYDAMLEAYDVPRAPIILRRMTLAQADQLSHYVQAYLVPVDNIELQLALKDLGMGRIDPVRLVGDDTDYFCYLTFTEGSIVRQATRQHSEDYATDVPHVGMWLQALAKHMSHAQLMTFLNDHLYLVHLGHADMDIYRRFGSLYWPMTPVANRHPRRRIISPSWTGRLNPVSSPSSLPSPMREAYIADWIRYNQSASANRTLYHHKTHGVSDTPYTVGSDVCFDDLWEAVITPLRNGVPQYAQEKHFTAEDLSQKLDWDKGDPALLDRAAYVIRNARLIRAHGTVIMFKGKPVLLSIRQDLLVDYFQSSSSAMYSLDYFNRRQSFAGTWDGVALHCTLLQLVVDDDGNESYRALRFGSVTQAGKYLGLHINKRESGSHLYLPIRKAAINHTLLSGVRGSRGYGHQYLAVVTWGFLE